MSKEEHPEKVSPISDDKLKEKVQDDNFWVMFTPIAVGNSNIVSAVEKIEKTYYWDDKNYKFELIFSQPNVWHENPTVLMLADKSEMNREQMHSILKEHKVEFITKDGVTVLFDKDVNQMFKAVSWLDNFIKKLGI